MGFVDPRLAARLNDSGRTKFLEGIMRDIDSVGCSVVDVLCECSHDQRGVLFDNNYVLANSPGYPPIKWLNHGCDEETSYKEFRNEQLSSALKYLAAVVYSRENKNVVFTDPSLILSNHAQAIVRPYTLAVDGEIDPNKSFLFYNFSPGTAKLHYDLIRSGRNLPRIC